jgi:hypothetical protein
MSLTPPREMPPKCHQLHPLWPKASGNMFQALVGPPHDGNNLYFDGGDEKTDNSTGNTVVNARPCDSGPPDATTRILLSCSSIHSMLESISNGKIMAQREDDVCLCAIEDRLVSITTDHQ